MAVKIELKMNADGRSWDVVKGGSIVSTHATIRDANDAKFDLTARKPRQVLAFKADGTEITKIIRRVA